jgi:DNA oxidative demethylase
MAGRGGFEPPEGFRFLPGLLDQEQQELILDAVLAAVEETGWFRPGMPRSGKPFSIEMCSLGQQGWVSDIKGYRYQPTHPVTGRPWPPIPEPVLTLWRDRSGYPHPPECCLVNLYRDGAKLGLHRDEDEATYAAPVLSLSLGDEAVFRVGGLERTDPTRSMRLKSGDLVVLDGAARLAFHGIDRTLPGSSRLVPGGGRINLTLRRVTAP